MVLFTPFGGKHISFGSTLKPNAASIKLLRELYDEYLPLFDSPYFTLAAANPGNSVKGGAKQNAEKKARVTRGITRAPKKLILCLALTGDS